MAEWKNFPALAQTQAHMHGAAILRGGTLTLMCNSLAMWSLCVIYCWQERRDNSQSPCSSRPGNRLCIRILQHRPGAWAQMCRCFALRLSCCIDVFIDVVDFWACPSFPTTLRGQPPFYGPTEEYLNSSLVVSVGSSLNWNP